MLERIIRLIKAYLPAKKVRILSDEELFIDGIYESMCNEPEKWKYYSPRTLAKKSITMWAYNLSFGYAVDINGIQYESKKISNKINEIVRSRSMKKALDGI